MAITATSYGLNHDAAFTGMVADGQVANIVSKINDDTATVAYGKGVVRNGEKGFLAATSTSVAGDFVGVLVRELNRSYADGATFGAPVDRPASVLTAGVIWVTVADGSCVKSSYMGCPVCPGTWPCMVNCATMTLMSVSLAAA